MSHRNSALQLTFGDRDDDGAETLQTHLAAQEEPGLEGLTPLWHAE